MDVIISFDSVEDGVEKMSFTAPVLDIMKFVKIKLDSKLWKRCWIYNVNKPDLPGFADTFDMGCIREGKKLNDLIDKLS